MRSTLLTVTILALAQAGLAQEQAPSETKDANAAAQEERATPRPTIRVLRDPHDLASFYRAGGSSPDGWAGLTSDPAYAIAGFYRSPQAGAQPSRYGWSAFWTNGYGARRPAPLPAFRRTIGDNGDLFLVVPFLAPVGPISGAFFGY